MRKLQLKLKQLKILLKLVPIQLMRNYIVMYTQTDTPKQKTEQKVRLIRYVDALREAFEQEMARDPNVFLFGLDVDDHKGIQGSTVGLQAKFGKERVFCTPLSEDAMTGVAV